ADELAELRAAGDVGALADVDEVGLGRDHQRLQATEPGVAGEGAHAASSRRGTFLGGTPATAALIARMWSGVVPQQPPTRFSSPSRAKPPRSRAMSSGLSS